MYEVARFISAFLCCKIKYYALDGRIVSTSSEAPAVRPGPLSKLRKARNATAMSGYERAFRQPARIPLPLAGWIAPAQPHGVLAQTKMALEDFPTPLFLHSCRSAHSAFSPIIYGPQHLAYYERMNTITPQINLENQLYNVYRFILSLPKPDKKPAVSKPIRSRRNRKPKDEVKAE
jgi:hypothetical protein